MKKNPSGQSLVEFVLLVPLFFIVISGMNLYLNQEIKSLTEDSTYDALLIADSNFDSAERVLAGWNAAKLKTSSYNSKIINNSFNASEYFSASVDMKDGVFLDKKKAKESQTTACATTPLYKSYEKKPGEFKFQSCVDGSGFETAHFSYQNMIEDFKTTKKTYEGKSVYSTNNPFSWIRRQFLALNAVQHFQMNAQEQSFRNLYASLAYPVDYAQFNAQCLMDPLTPQCSLPTLAEKWRRAAFDGANTQVLECLAEASAKCLKMLAPPAVAGCVVERTAEIAAALAAGQKATVCPILNRITETIYNEVLMTAKGYRETTRMQEFIKKKEKILIQMLGKWWQDDVAICKRLFSSVGRAED